MAGSGEVAGRPSVLVSTLLVLCLTVQTQHMHSSEPSTDEAAPPWIMLLVDNAPAYIPVCQRPAVAGPLVLAYFEVRALMYRIPSARISVPAEEAQTPFSPAS